MGDQSLDCALANAHANPPLELVLTNPLVNLLPLTDVALPHIDLPAPVRAAFLVRGEGELARLGEGLWTTCEEDEVRACLAIKAMCGSSG
jgi:hypothetical protein